MVCGSFIYTNVKIIQRLSCLAKALIHIAKSFSKAFFAFGLF